MKKLVVFVALLLTLCCLITDGGIVQERDEMIYEASQVTVMVDHD